MTQVEELVEAITILNDEQRSLVLDFARMLRARAPCLLPDDLSADGPDYQTWRVHMDRHAEGHFRLLRSRLEALGIPPDGDLPRSGWPVDMNADSPTSVET